MYQPIRLSRGNEKRGRERRKGLNKQGWQGKDSDKKTAFNAVN